MQPQKLYQFVTQDPNDYETQVDPDVEESHQSIVVSSFSSHKVRWECSKKWNFKKKQKCNYVMNSNYLQ